MAISYNPIKAGNFDGNEIEIHDKGIVRALEANYRPPIVDSDVKANLFVGNLSLETTEDMVKSHFAKFGTINCAKLIRDLVTGFSKRYAFVEYEAREAASKAHMQKYVVMDSRELIIEYECGRSLQGWIPRRLGGGYGGKRESGQLRYGGRYRPFTKRCENKQ